MAKHYFYKLEGTTPVPCSKEDWYEFKNLRHITDTASLVSKSCIGEWHDGGVVITTRFASVDYNFELPDSPLAVFATSVMTKGDPEKWEHLSRYSSTWEESESVHDQIERQVLKELNIDSDPILIRKVRPRISLDWHWVELEVG